MSGTPKWVHDESVCPCGKPAGPEFRYGLCDSCSKACAEASPAALQRMATVFMRGEIEKAKVEKSLEIVRGDYLALQRAHKALTFERDDLAGKLLAVRETIDVARRLLGGSAT